MLALLRDVDVAAHLARAAQGVRRPTGDVRFDVGHRTRWLEARHAVIIGGQLLLGRDAPPPLRLPSR
jgi:hypothetical protein